MHWLRRQPRTHDEVAGEPDARLVAWARQNPQAFTALYDRHFAAVYRYCRSRLGDPDAAEDATSQTFLKALVALPDYRETGRFRSWLFTIAHNEVLDAQRRRVRDLPLDAAFAVVDSAESPEEQAVRAISHAWLDTAIASLPGDDQQVLELRRAGLTGAEIAVVLGISHEAAKKRQSRAIARIREQLVERHNEREVSRGA